jgi:hypothetical protein
MRVGIDREQALCAVCGHPSMAHYPDGCYCGCKRPTRATKPEPPEAEAPVHKLLDFMHDHLSKAQRDRLIELIARHKHVPPPAEPRTHAATQRFIVANLTRTETLRYLDELRRRRAAGEPLVRD